MHAFTHVRQNHSSLPSGPPGTTPLSSKGFALFFRRAPRMSPRADGSWSALGRSRGVLKAQVRSLISPAMWGGHGQKKSTSASGVKHTHLHSMRPRYDVIMYPRTYMNTKMCTRTNIFAQKSCLPLFKGAPCGFGEEIHTLR